MRKNQQEPARIGKNAQEPARTNKDRQALVRTGKAGSCGSILVKARLTPRMRAGGDQAARSVPATSLWEESAAHQNVAKR